MNRIPPFEERQAAPATKSGVGIWIVVAVVVVFAVFQLVAMIG